MSVYRQKSPVDTLQLHLIKVPHQAGRLCSLRSLGNKIEILKEWRSLRSAVAIASLSQMLLAYRSPVLL